MRLKRAGGSEAGTKVETPSRKKEATIRIKGMHCATCVDTVKEALMSLKGVENASVNLATEKATFTYDPSLVNMDMVEKAVRESGYEVAKDQLSLTIGGMHCATCAITVQEALDAVLGAGRAMLAGEGRIDHQPALSPAVT